MSQKITSVYPSTIGHNDKIIISNNIINALRSRLGEDKDCMTLLLLLKDKNDDLKEALSGVKRKSPFTLPLQNIVSDRAKTISFINKFIIAQIMNPVDAKKMKAAGVLQFALAVAFRTHRAGGSRAAEEIIKVCAQKKYKEIVKLLAMEPVLENLAELQAVFTETYTNKVTTEHEKREINIVMASKQVFDSLESLFDYISSQAVLQKGPYIKAINTINEILEDVVSAARGRRTRAGNKNGEEIVADKVPVTEQII